MYGRALVTSLLISSLLLLAYAQQPQPSAPPQKPPPTEEQDIVRITTNLVQVDAVVTKDGKPITDLRAEDFEIFEDGRPQKITNFSYVSNIPAIPSAPSSPRRPAKGTLPVPEIPVAPHPHDTRRTIALVIDDLGMSFESIAQMKRQARKFVEEQMQPNDLVAI